jgi:hypothetical protein
MLQAGWVEVGRPIVLMIPGDIDHRHAVAGDPT